ncbi:HNH endonuclease [Paraliomyxa miuraensis]|uniref:HNH endonuclease n=1 Tax=Paraliomyxa miuraensis TaxID=376150 RepID=UPI00224F948C|nr:HNH endonuclease [Paraliomyxa miuraensis]MCX4243514.1 HNH endonuclease [Paraliomyxa miuraensis]
MREVTRRRLLWCAATDSSFERIELADGPALEGKCLHCSRKLLLRADGEPISRATIEHIVPRTHGGGDELSNLGIACARCNHGKGVRLDVRRADDPTLRRVIETLRERRRARWREPPSDWDLPSRP